MLAQRIGRIVEAAERARDLIARILAFSRQQAEEMRPVQLAAVVGEALHLIQVSAPANVEIVTRSNADNDTVMGDATQIHQIVMNLCTNAVHALGENGGRLEIQTEAVHLDAEAAGRYLNLAPGDYARLIVSDNGCGMDQRTLARIFDPYFTTKTSGQGTGLGLAMVHGIVQRMAGAIKAYSEPGRGTSFHVYFPKIDSDSAQAQRTPNPKPVGGSERILLVDDEPIVLEMTAESLASLGYRVESRSSAIEAFHAFNAHPARFDLVIADMTMPAMSGKQLAKKIAAIRPDLPIILCSGFSVHGVGPETAAHGVRAVLLKPILLRDLAAAVRRALGHGPATDVV